jgi:hypothetical protein
MKTNSYAGRQADEKKKKETRSRRMMTGHGDYSRDR